MTLEEKITNHKLTLKEETIEHIKKFPTTLKQYCRELGPLILPMAGIGGLAQAGAQKMGFDTPAQMTLAAIVVTYPLYYSTVFVAEYIRNKPTYQKSKKLFGKYMLDFLAADYVADLTSYTPIFVGTNLWLGKHDPQMQPIERNMIASIAGSTVYIINMAAFLPIIRKATEISNRAIESTYRAIFKPNAPTT